jgi:hypothetical protein
MSNTAQVATMSLQTAVLAQVQEFYDEGTTFSIHDITRTLRTKCNNGELEIPEVESPLGSDNHRFVINHAEVKNLFLQLRNTGAFSNVNVTLSENFNGNYWEYTPSASTLTVSTPKTSQVSSTTIYGELDRRISVYLNNCAARRFFPSIKEVQSAIKRGNRSTGVSAKDLRSYIETALGYKIQNGTVLV